MSGRMIASLLCVAALIAPAWPVARAAPETNDSGRVSVAWTFTFRGEDPSSPSSLDAVLVSARASHVPVLVDFSARWCAACRLLDRDTYTSPDVVREARRFVTVRIDATNDDPATKVLADRFEVRGLPTVAFVSSRGEALSSPRVLGLVTPSALVIALRKVH